MRAPLSNMRRQWMDFSERRRASSSVRKRAPCRLAFDQSCERQERDLCRPQDRGRIQGDRVSGNTRPERAKVPALARAHEIDAILVAELSRWDGTTQDPVQTLDERLKSQ